MGTGYGYESFGAKAGKGGILLACWNYRQQFHVFDIEGDYLVVRYRIPVTDSLTKGRQEHPGFPRPLIQELPMRIPFRRESPQEEKYVASSFAQLCAYRMPGSLAREALHIQTMLDSLDDELTTDDIVTREKALDKELIVLFQGACKANNIPRAIELVNLSHYTSALDAAIKLAEFYRLVGLKEKIAMIKSEREETEDRLTLARNKRRRWLRPEPPLRQVAESSTSASRFDPLGDVRPPPMIERPGMARVTVPVIETTRYSSLAPTLVPNTTSLTQETPTWDNSQLMESPPPTDSKRKRAEIDESFPSSDFPMPPPKQSRFRKVMNDRRPDIFHRRS